MDSARHVKACQFTQDTRVHNVYDNVESTGNIHPAIVKRMVNPRCLGLLASYDVACFICPSVLCGPRVWLGVFYEDPGNAVQVETSYPPPC